MIDLKKILVKEYSFEDFFNLKGLAELIQEYVNSSNNPLVQDVDITYIDEVKDAEIRNDVIGSDHCPVVLHL